MMISACIFKNKHWGFHHSVMIKPCYVIDMIYGTFLFVFRFHFVYNMYIILKKKVRNVSSLHAESYKIFSSNRTKDIFYAMQHFLP